MNLASLSKYKITVIGDLMIDEYWSGQVNRISSEAPVPIIKIDENRYRVGGAGNVAMNLRALGVNARLVSCIGKDKESSIIKRLLKKNKVSTIFTFSKNKKIIKKLRILGNNQQILRADFEEDHKNYIVHKNQKIINCIKTSDVVIFSDYNKGSLSKIEEFIKLANKYKKIIIVDPKGNDFKKYKNATTLTPNLAEFTNIVGEAKNNNQIIKKGKKLIKELNLTSLIVTKGDKGMTIITKNKSLNLQSVTQEVYDVTGAGDTVIAAVSTFLAIGKDIFEAANFANKAASISVKKIGTSVVTIKELKKLA